MKWIDLPPFWLLGCLVLSWIVPLSLPALRSPWVAGVLILGAVILTGAAIWEFMRARTSVVPRRTPSALIDTGIFRLSRNPIYVADLLVLAGFSIWTGSLTGLILVPVLAGILQTRFIRGEEDRLSEAFGPAYEAYRERVRRWL